MQSMNGNLGGWLSFLSTVFVAGGLALAGCAAEPVDSKETLAGVVQANGVLVDGEGAEHAVDLSAVGAIADDKVVELAGSTVDGTFVAYDFDFPPFQVRTLSVNNPSPASGTVTTPGIDCGSDCTTIYPKGATVTLKAKAKPGKLAESWIGCDSSTVTSCTVKLDTNRTVGIIWGTCTPEPEATECMNACQDPCLEAGKPPALCLKMCVDQCNICAP
jgi:hypothetical protein